MKTALTITVAALLATMAIPAAPLKAEPRAMLTAGTVKVTVQYKGKGTVDASHKLWIWVFDTPNIGAGSMPIDQISLERNGADAVFEGIASAKVWIAAAFDESGAMSGDAPPPSGTPIGILMSKDGVPLAILPGSTEAAVLAFDDSQRMP